MILRVSLASRGDSIAFPTSVEDGGSCMSALLQDLRFALRLLVKNPGFALIAAIIMALGIGANTAIFTIVNKVLLEPLPFRDVDRIVQVWHTPPQSSFPGITTFSISPANFLDWQRQNHVFESMALYSGASFDLTGTGKPEAISSKPRHQRLLLRPRSRTHPRTHLSSRGEQPRTESRSRPEL